MEQGTKSEPSVMLQHLHNDFMKFALDVFCMYNPPLYSSAVYFRFLSQFAVKPLWPSKSIFVWNGYYKSQSKYWHNFICLLHEALGFQYTTYLVVMTTYFVNVLLWSIVGNFQFKFLLSKDLERKWILILLCFGITTRLSIFSFIWQICLLWLLCKAL